MPAEGPGDRRPPQSLQVAKPDDRIKQYVGGTPSSASITMGNLSVSVLIGLAMMLRLHHLIASASFVFPQTAGLPETGDIKEMNKLHIVYLGGVPRGYTSEAEIRESHIKLLSSVKPREDVARASHVVSYTKSFNGFAAILSLKEVKTLRETKGVISVFESKIKHLLTTRSWDFVGLTSTSPRNATGESNVIVGIIDSGVWPENPMFNDTHFGPIPRSWKGECVAGVQFTPANCNKKVIGAKYFYKGIEAAGLVLGDTEVKSARDTDGHGSHTSSTAAGAVATGASLYGLAEGNARGGVPGARVAIYKVCWLGGFCNDADILSAFDEALHDGVHLLSLSIGGLIPHDYSVDTIAIAAFHATQQGVLVSCAAGNAHPSFPAVNIAPWILTVAASSIDRSFFAPVLLGNNRTITGTCLNTYTEDKWFPLISGANGDFENSTYDLSFCDVGVLDPHKVKGKIVYCEEGGNGNVDESVRKAKGVGLIYSIEDPSVAFTLLVPTSIVGTSEGALVASYINETRNPTAKILPCEASFNVSAPTTAYFSSRGPNIISPDIMKPDIAAPGVDILAAWSLKDTITDNLDLDNRFSMFNIISGTSMATPHAAGAAAYVKSFHPEWSPAAVKSALMTTAKPFDPSLHHNEDMEFGYGAGQINPTAAIDPGLVYDAGWLDYALYLCTHGYNSSQLAVITGVDSVRCPASDGSDAPASLNYPAVVAAYPIDLKNSWYTTTRTVTYVATPSNATSTTFAATLQAPPGMDVQLSTSQLTFTSAGQQQSFQVSVRAPGLGSVTTLSASLVWSSASHSVRTPVLAYLLSD